jgi:hypothetical protein
MEPVQSKRKAEAPAVGDGAVFPEFSSDDPKTMQDIKKAHPNLCEKSMTNYKLVLGRHATQKVSAELWDARSPSSVGDPESLSSLKMVLMVPGVPLVVA